MTKQTFKVGDKLIYGEGEWFEEGTVVTVLEVDSDDKEMPYLVSDGESDYWVDVYSVPQKVSDKPTKNQRITALEQKVADLQAEVEALKKAQTPTITQNITVKSDADIPKVAGQLTKLIEGEMAKPVLTPNQARKAIIDEAKAFVAKYSGVVKSNTTPYTTQCGDTEIRLFVNAEKRVVTAIPYLVHAEFCDNRNKAIAKCAPDDVFNADIGKAIVLGRALGLDVSKFEQAVQPTEVVVGHQIKYTDNLALTGMTRKVSEVTERRITFDNDKTFTDWSGGKVNRYLGKAFEIIDDTEAQYV